MTAVMKEQHFLHSRRTSGSSDFEPAPALPSRPLDAPDPATFPAAHEILAEIGLVRSIHLAIALLAVVGLGLSGIA